MKPKNLTIASVFLALGAVSIQAQTWDNGASTQAWLDDANWNPDGAPTNGGWTINTDTAGQTPIITTAVTNTGADSWIGNGGSGVLDISTGGSLDSSTKWLFVGSGGGSGILNINGGTLTSDNRLRLDNGQLNISNGGSATVTQVNSGASSTISVTGNSSLTTTEAANLDRLTVTGLTGTVSGGGSVFLASGNHDVASGGSLIANDQIFIGNGVTSQLTVDAGIGSIANNTWLPVGIGAGGNGTLVLESGTINASQTNPSSFTTIGANNDAVGVVTINGGTYNQNGAGIVMGEGGTAQGTVNLNGGELNTGRVWSNNGNATLNLNGGTLRATRDEASFISDNVNVDVQAGGAIIDTNGFNVTAAASLDGVGELTKSGTGNLTLSATGNSLTTVSLDAGGLYLAEDLATSGGITVAAGATLGASDAAASVTGDITFLDGALIDVTNGVISLSSGTLAFADFGFDDIVGFDVNSAADGLYTIVDGSFTLDSSGIQNFGESNALDLGSGRSAWFEEGSLNVMVQTIPEPSAAILGFIGLLALARRRRV